MKSSECNLGRPPRGDHEERTAPIEPDRVEITRILDGLARGEKEAARDLLLLDEALDYAFRRPAPAPFRLFRLCATIFRLAAIIKASAYSSPMSRAPLRYS
jgi:hypothetical protein